MAGRGDAHEIAAPIITNKTIPGHQLPGVSLAPGLEVGGSFVQRALEHLRGLQGFANLPAEFEADPTESRTSGGGVTVHLRQQFKSIPIFLAAQAVRFRPDGQVDSTTGNTFAISEDIPVEPRLTAAQAVLEAAKHAAQLGQSLLGEEDDFGNALDVPSLDLSAFRPQVQAAFPELPTRPTVLAPGPFAHPIKASLLWFASPNKLVLGWEVLLTMPSGAGQYRVIVDTNSGAILYSRQLVDLLIARASVFVAEGPPSQRQTLTVPRPWTDYQAGFDPGGLALGVPPQPLDWIDDGSTDTSGNCVVARLGDSGPALVGRKEGDVLVFEPSQPDGDDQKVLNIFYYNSFLHDLFYLLGFREEDGNFQARGIGGVGGDPVDARAHSGPVWGTANMLTPPDGSSPTMNMGLVTSTNRHTAFDASVVFHEYMHGVTNRLVGGPMNTRALETPQSKAMGEGWGDYLACTILGKMVVGDWVKRDPRGIRSHPYDDQYPGTFGQIGTGIYTQAHRVGEIWCAALMATNRNLNVRLGAPRGQRLALQLVVDALKLSPANPNMLDMRNAILAALDQKRNASPGLSATDYASSKAAIWTAFAKFGMGVGGRSAGGDFGNVAEDFNPGAADSTPSSGPDSTLGTGGPTGTGTVRVQEAQRVAIPDANEIGMTRRLRIGAPGRIRRAKLRVDIMHPYVGDLVVRLTAPGQQPITIYKQAYQAAPDLIAEYTTGERLSGLLGQPAQGDWELTVADMSPGDIGLLRGWGLEVEVEGGAPLVGSGFSADPSVDLAAELRGLTAALGDLAERIELRR